MEALRALLLSGRYAELLERTADAPQGAALALRSRALQRLGQGDQALTIARQAVEQGAGLEGDVALAEALLSTGALSEGRALLRRAEAPELRRLQAELLAAAGQAEQALPLAVEVLGGAESPLERAQALGTLAACLHRAGQYEAARPRWEQALRATALALGDGHPELPALMDGLGLTLRRLGEHARALDLHEKALVLHQQHFGAWHPAVAGSLHAQAQALHRMGEFLQARDALEEAWQVSARVQGAAHPDSLVTAFELGRMELDCGQVAVGLSRMAEAHERCRQVLGPEHPTVLAMARWL